MELEAAIVQRRQRFSLEQKRQMVEATLAPGASVARVTREHGVNANQVFALRKLYQQGLLEERSVGGVKLLPVRVAGLDRIESLSGLRLVRTLRTRFTWSLPVKHWSPWKAVRTSSLCTSSWSVCCVIELRTGTGVWIVAGVTDLRRGFTGLSAMVQTTLEQDPFSGHVFVFRGRRGVHQGTLVGR
jgi:transposase-like protein